MPPKLTHKFNGNNPSVMATGQKRPKACAVSMFASRDFRLLYRTTAADTYRCTCMLWPDTARATKKRAGTANIVIGSTEKCWYRRLTQLHSTPITRQGEQRRRSLRSRTHRQLSLSHTREQQYCTAVSAIGIPQHKNKQSFYTCVCVVCRYRYLAKLTSRPKILTPFYSTVIH